MKRLQRRLLGRRRGQAALVSESPERAALRELVAAAQEAVDADNPFLSQQLTRLRDAIAPARELLAQTDEQRRVQALAEFEEYAQAQGWTGNALRRQGWLAARGLL